MELTKGDLDLFVKFALLDETKRARGPKQHAKPMIGNWMCRLREDRAHESDLVLRRNVCIEMLNSVGGLSISKAAVEVATGLRLTTQSKVNTIRESFYARPPAPFEIDLFVRQFLDVRNWVFLANEAQLDRDLTRYEQDYGRERRDRLADFYKLLRK